jgi:hypothetical protein
MSWTWDRSEINAELLGWAKYSSMVGRHAYATVYTSDEGPRLGPTQPNIGLPFIGSRLDLLGSFLSTPNTK